MNISKRNTKKKYRVFNLLNANLEPAIENVHYPRNRTLTAIDEIYDEETGENRIIRYIPGETSIYLDEQTDKDIHNLKRRPFQLSFTNGYMTVDNRQATLIKFIEKCNFYADNDNRMPGVHARFEESRPENTAKEAMEDDMKIANAKAMVYGMKLKELVSLARILNVNVDREIDLIRWDMAQIADRDPDWFVENRESPNTMRLHYLYEAIDADIIFVSNADRTVRWANKQAIVQAPVGVSALDAMVDLTFTPEGEAVYETILSKLKPEEEVETQLGTDVDTRDVKFNPKEEKEDKPRFSTKDMATEVLFDMCFAEGVIDKKGVAQYSFKGVLLGNGRSKAIEFLDEPKKKTLRKSISKALEAKKNA